jgi:hypothetical protein
MVADAGLPKGFVYADGRVPDPELQRSCAAQAAQLREAAQ